MFTSIQTVLSSQLWCLTNDTRRRVLCVLAMAATPVFSELTFTFAIRYRL